MAPMMIVYRIVAKDARPATDWGTAAVRSAVQFAPATHESITEGSTGTHDNSNSAMAIISSSGTSTNQEKFTSPNV